VELLDYFRGLRPWPQLARYLRQLQQTPTSRYVVAQQDDDELALVAARMRRDNAQSAAPVRYRPPATAWGIGEELWAKIFDRLGEIEALLSDLPIAGKKRKAKPPKRYPRPETAVDRAELRLSQEHVHEIIDDVESSYVTTEEYERVAAEVEAQREAARTAAHSDV
jgi:hypothetical protein